MDVLSDVLLAVRLTGAVYFDIDARSPFVAQSPPTDVIAAKVAADAEHLIAFHVLTSGSCWVEAVDEPEPAELMRAGEMVIFSCGEANILSSEPGMRGQPDLSRYYRPVGEALPFVIDINGDAHADRCRIVCGYLACDRAPVQPVAGVVAQDGPRPGVRPQLGVDDRPAGRGDRGERRARRRAGGDAGEAVRADVPRGAPHPHRRVASRHTQLGGRSARPARSARRCD